MAGFHLGSLQNRTKAGVPQKKDTSKRVLLLRVRLTFACFTNSRLENNHVGGVPEKYPLVGG